MDQLKPDDAVQQQLTGAGVDVQKSAEKDGVTLTVRQTVGDKSRMYILLDVEAPEGVILGENYSFENYDILLSGTHGWGMGVKPLDEDFTDNKASYLLDVSTTDYETSFAGQTAKLTLSNLRDWQQGEGDQGEYVSVLPGEWSVEWALDFEDVTRAYPVDTEVPYCDGEARVTMLTVSPLSVSVTVQGEGVVGTGGSAWDGKSLNEDIVVKVKLKDGTVLYDKAATHISLDPGAGICRVNRAFENALNVEEIAAVIVNGVEIPLE